MKKYLLLLLLFSYVIMTSLIAQPFKPYIPITYKNYTPIWSHYSKVNNFSDNVETYFQRQIEIAKDEKVLYTLHNIADTFYIQGFLLEKIDLTTGKTLWQDHLFSNKKGERSLASHFTVQNNKLKLAIFKENQPPGPFVGFPSWSKSILRSYTYNDNSSKKIDSLIVDPSDKKTVKLGASLVASHLFNNSDGTFDYINHAGYTDPTVSQSFAGLTKMVLNSSGNKIDSIQIQINTPKIYQSARLFRKTDGTYQFFVNVQKIDSTNKENVKLYTLDKNLNIVKTIDLSNQLSTPINAIYYLDDKYFIVGFFDNKTINGVFRGKVNYVLFKQDGTKLESITDEYNYYDCKGVHVALLENKTMVVVKLLNEKNGDNKIVFSQSDGKNQLSELKAIVVQDTNIQFQVFRNIIVTKENNILVGCTYAHKANLFDSSCPKWADFTLFSGKDLGMATTSNTEATVQNVTFDLMPNPAQNQLNIISDSEFDRAKVYDITGQIRLDAVLDGTTLDVESLSDGMYFVELYQNNKKISSAKKFIKI